MKTIYAGTCYGVIHQKLYQSDDIATISMPEYINELVIYAHDSFDTS